MRDTLLQAVREKLKRRVERLNAANAAQFPASLALFFHFLDATPLLAAVVHDLLARTAGSDVIAIVEQIANKERLRGSTEEEEAAIGYLVLKGTAARRENLDPNSIGTTYGGSWGGADFLELTRTLFLRPLYEYIDEHIDGPQAMLYLLLRYKHRSEWFHADRLRGIAENDSQRGEKGLALDLYEYLHGQGLDIHIEPRSASGIPDFVADQAGHDRVIADTKLFWPEKSKGKPYIISGFHQAYTYACDFNESFAYLVIYKLCREALNFLVPAGDASFPCLTVNHKTIFFVVVDICDHGASASKRGPMRSIDITESELAQSISASMNP
jgi:hypothetical protein